MILNRKEKSFKWFISMVYTW